MSRIRIWRLLAVSVPASLLAIALMVVAIEVWVRLTWDPKKGLPGFYLSDPVRGQRLAPNYSGWFAGVPVQINSLGFRDPREYELSKTPNTFRILVLGDSITFGHGSIFEHTYPSLLEDKLKKWQPDVDWQVWNAGVPGYNTTQELAYLLDKGPAFQPDLVVVGFYINDIVDNHPIREPGTLDVFASDAMSFLQRHWYSLELYKRVYLTLAWRLSASKAYRLRFEHLNTEEQLLANRGNFAEAPEQRLTPFRRLSDDEVRAIDCAGGQQPNPAGLLAMQRDQGWKAFVDAVEEVQRVHASGAHRVVFFLNTTPLICPDGDFFYDGGSAAENQFFVDLFAKGTPTVSAYDAFRRVRPSEMPRALDHALGNASLVKAEVLFGFLRDSVLPPLLEARAAARQPAPALPQD